MAVNSCEKGQDAYSISVLPDEGTTDPQSERQIACLSHSEVPNPINSQMCLDAQLNCQNCISQEMENADSYSPCIVNVDIEKGNSGTTKTDEEAAENMKSEGPLTHLQNAFQRQINLQIGKKFMRLLMNDSFVLPKFTSRDKSATERVHETPNNRTRKFKRSASFNSREVVLLFSVLSSMGTMVLIYLTLRETGW